MAGGYDSLNPKPRRFYKQAEVVATAAGGASSWAIALDGRTAKTPAGRPLVAPTEALAQRIAEEWSGQGEVIDVSRMPLTRWIFTTLDRKDGADQAMAKILADHAGADLLCYRAEGPAELVVLEAEAWDPILTWAEQSLGLVFVVTSGIMHRSQPEATLARVADLALALDPFRRTGLAFAAGLFGSAVLSFAVAQGRLGGEAAFDLSRLDEAHQAARWGVDAEAATRTASLRQDARTLQLWFNLL